MNNAGKMDEIRKWVVNDYFTPNIKAEVILDTLLTPYITEILTDQATDIFSGELCFITKEMSVLESEESKKGSGYGNMGTKIDYVLGDEKAVYLVELKTTDSSIKKEQAQRDAYSLVFKTWYLGGAYDMDVPSKRFAEAAMKLIKKAGWTQKDGFRSRKYPYTAGQLLDYLYPDKSLEHNLWHKPLGLIYLTPEGELSVSFENALDRENWDGFYTGSFSLKEAGSYLETKQNRERDELALLLSKIIKDIYPDKG